MHLEIQEITCRLIEHDLYYQWQLKKAYLAGYKMEEMPPCNASVIFALLKIPPERLEDEMALYMQYIVMKSGHYKSKKEAMKHHMESSREII